MSGAELKCGTGTQYNEPLHFPIFSVQLAMMLNVFRMKSKTSKQTKARKVVRTSAEDFKVFYLLLSGKKRVIFLYPCENLTVNSFWQKE